MIIIIALMFLAFIGGYFQFRDSYERFKCVWSIVDTFSGLFFIILFTVFFPIGIVYLISKIVHHFLLKENNNV